jgi:leucyl-tRNA synthetase
MMEFYNFLSELNKIPDKESIKTFVVLLSPFVPHIAEELWEQLGETSSLADQSWPKYNPAALVSETQQIVVQVNGKLRGHIEVPTGASEEVVKAEALADTKVKVHVDGKELVKSIYIPGKLLNLVVKG